MTSESPQRVKQCGFRWLGFMENPKSTLHQKSRVHYPENSLNCPYNTTWNEGYLYAILGPFCQFTIEIDATLWPLIHSSICSLRMPSSLPPRSARSPEQSASLLIWWLENLLKSFTRGRERITWSGWGRLTQREPWGSHNVPLLDLGNGYTGVFILSFIWLINCNGHTFYMHITLQLFKVYFKIHILSFLSSKSCLFPVWCPGPITFSKTGLWGSLSFFLSFVFVVVWLGVIWLVWGFVGGGGLLSGWILVNSWMIKWVY